jgi:hypothetical protein
LLCEGPAQGVLGDTDFEDYAAGGPDEHPDVAVTG